MRQLHDFTTVACPYEDVPGLLHTYFGRRTVSATELLTDFKRILTKPR